MREGFHKSKNPFDRGDLFHIHTVRKDIIDLYEKTGEMEVIDTSFDATVTQAGKAFNSGLESEDNTFEFDGNRYQILGGNGYFDFSDNEVYDHEGHKHYRFDQEAINFFVRRLTDNELSNTIDA